MFRVLTPFSMYDFCVALLDSTVFQAHQVQAEIFLLVRTRVIVLSHHVLKCIALLWPEEQKE